LAIRAGVVQLVVPTGIGTCPVSALSLRDCLAAALSIETVLPPVGRVIASRQSPRPLAFIMGHRPLHVGCYLHGASPFQCRHEPPDDHSALTTHDRLPACVELPCQRRHAFATA